MPQITRAMTTPMLSIEVSTENKLKWYTQYTNVNSRNIRNSWDNIQKKILYMQSHTDVDTNELIITRAKRDLAAATLPSTYHTQSAKCRWTTQARMTLVYQGYNTTQARNDHVINKCTTLTQYTRCYENYA